MEPGRRQGICVAAGIAVLGLLLVAGVEASVQAAASDRAAATTPVPSYGSGAYILTKRPCAAPYVAVGDGCYDSSAFTASEWSVGASSATLNHPGDGGWKGQYHWSLPSQIEDGKPFSIDLSVTSTDVANGSGFCGAIGFGGSPEPNESIQACASVGKSANKAQSFKVTAYGAGSELMLVTIGIQGGPTIDYFYDEADTAASPPGTTKQTETQPMTWAMPDRFGPKDPDGLVHYITSPGDVDPSHWPVDLTLKSCDQKELDKYEWKVDGDADPETHVVPGKRCTVAVDVGTLGEHTVTAKAPDGTEGIAQVDARDFLIVGLGDSNGSGEGTPDKPGVGVTWEDERCDRSAKSYEAQAALGVENEDDHSSVTFVHLACSGATVVNGLLGPYEGINPPKGEPPLPSQLSQLGTLVGKRPVDAVIVSIGVNDLKFGAMTGFCIDQGLCQDKKYPDAKSDQTLDEWMKQHVAALPGLYDQVAARIARLGIPQDRVYISQYFDSTRDEHGDTCNPLMSVPGAGVFTRPEAAWAYANVLVPLNEAVAAAASKHGWHLISGAQQAFHDHGYCSTTPWITTLSDSLAHQHDKNGTLHANEAGQAVDAKLALDVLLPDLFPDGKPRPVGAGSRPGSGSEPTSSEPATTTTAPETTTTEQTTTSGGGAKETTQQALDDVLGLLKASSAACGFSSWNVKASGTPGDVTVTATITGTLAGTATWSTAGGSLKPTNALAAKASSGCG